MNRTHFVVAIVDDDSRVLESLADLLESAGHAVMTYRSAQEMLDDGSLAVIDLLISDICMPTMDGVELRRRVKSVRPDLPVVLITGAAVTADLATEVLPKPIDPPVLLAAIDLAFQPRPC
jgi:FixJ family two-component response regulator